MKIVAIVKLNNIHAYVFDEMPAYVGKKISDKSIISTNGLIYRFYEYEYCSFSKAFAGIKFDLQMEDGSTFTCKDVWWDSINDEMRKYVGKGIYYITFSTVDDLKRCYCFSGAYILEGELDKYIQEYNGKIYEYFEYKREVIEPLKNKEKSDYRSETIQNIVECGFRQIGKGRNARLSNEEIEIIIDNTNYWCKKSPDDVLALPFAASESTSKALSYLMMTCNSWSMMSIKGVMSLVFSRKYSINCYVRRCGNKDIDKKD